MGLTQVVAGVARLSGLGDWRSTYNFDSPGLPLYGRVDRLEYAAQQARRCCYDKAAKTELDFVLEECEELRHLTRQGPMNAEVLEGERVEQRLARVRRVVLHHEGVLVRINRRYWWIPFSITLLAMVACCVQSLRFL